MDRFKTIISVVPIVLLSFNTLQAQDTILHGQSQYYLFHTLSGTWSCLAGGLPIYYRLDGPVVEEYPDDTGYYLYAEMRDRYYVQTPTPVYGIAMTTYHTEFTRPDEWTNWFNGDGDGDALYYGPNIKRHLEDYRLTLEVKQQDGSFMPIDTAHYYADSCYYMLHDDAGGHTVAMPCYEYYFDAPHTLTDTFYIRLSIDEETVRNYPSDVPSRDIALIKINPGIYNDVTEEYKNYMHVPGRTTEQYMSFYGGTLHPILQPDRPYCNAVGGLRLEERGEDWARFVWDDAGDSVEYQLVFGHDHTHPVNLYDTTYTISGLDSGRYYDVRLRRVCHHDCPYHTDTVVYGAYSAAVRFWVGSTDPANMGVEAADADGGLEVYPNPSSGVVTVVVGRPVGGTLEVHDAVGRTVLRSERLEREMRLDLSQLPRGVYTVTLDSPDGIATRRLVLQ